MALPAVGSTISINDIVEKFNLERIGYVFFSDLIFLLKRRYM